MSSTKFNIVGIGEILWDLYESEKFLGGAPANFAIHCQQLGDRGIIVSRIAKDELGQEILNSLQKRGLETNYIQLDSNKPTGLVKVTLDKNGKPKFECTTDVAFDYLEINAKLNRLTDDADAILFGTLAQRNNRTRETIQQFLKRATQAFKIHDINLRGWSKQNEEIIIKSLTLADAIKLNDDELNTLRTAWQPNLDDIDFLQFLIEKYQLKLAALTLGENGSILINRDEVVEQNGIKIKPIDTTGCGDAFAAGMIHYYLRKKPLSEIAAFANLLGAFVALFPGATPEYSFSNLSRFQQEIGD
jgi:fructokinase